MGCAASSSAAPAGPPPAFADARGLSTDSGNAGTAPALSNVGPALEVDVCAAEELREGELREVALRKDTPALLVRDRGVVYALGARCPHAGAPLAKGVLSSGRVRCPWHGACFRLDSGDLEAFPGLDSLPRFEAREDGGRVKVRVAKEQLGTTRRVRPLRIAAPGAGSDDVAVIVGSGAAGATAAETLRQEGYEGRLLLVSSDSHLPYDRTKLSKAPDSRPEAIRLREEHFYAVYDIELRLGVSAVGLDAPSRRLLLSDGSALTFTKLLLATGLRARQLSVPGSELDGVLTLRSLSDSQRLAAVASGKRLVVVGGSFVAMEAAAALQPRARAITVVVRSAVPFAAAFGERVGAALMAGHVAKGVAFRCGASVARLEPGADGRLGAVVLTSGERLDADLCLAAVGAVPNVSELTRGAIELDAAGRVMVSERMESSQGAVFAAGDVASAPLPSGGRCTAGHWHMAQSHGRAAALAMLGRRSEPPPVPFFWTVLFGISVRFCGRAEGHSEVLVHGDAAALRFVAFYLRGETVVAACSANFDPVVAQLAEMIAAGRAVLRHEVLDDPRAFAKRLGGAAARS